MRHFTWRGFTGSELSGEPLPPGIYRIVGGPGAGGHSMGASPSDAVSVELVAEPAS